MDPLKSYTELEQRVQRLEAALFRLTGGACCGSPTPALGTAGARPKGTVIASELVIDIDPQTGVILPPGTLGPMVIKNARTERFVAVAGTLAVSVEPEATVTLGPTPTADGRGILVETLRRDWYDPCWPVPEIGTACVVFPIDVVLQSRRAYFRDGDAIPAGTVFNFDSNGALVMT